MTRSGVAEASPWGFLHPLVGSGSPEANPTKYNVGVCRLPDCELRPRTCSLRSQDLGLVQIRSGGLSLALSRHRLDQESEADHGSKSSLNSSKGGISESGLALCCDDIRSPSGTRTSGIALLASPRFEQGIARSLVEPYRDERSESRFHRTRPKGASGSFSPSFYQEWFAGGEPDEVKSGSMPPPGL